MLTLFTARRAASTLTLFTRDVWANYLEADFQRKNLRRRYQHLRLSVTSYPFITLYKQRLSRPQTRAHTTNNARTVEACKLLQHFRQFLADEGCFWRVLVLRLQRAYACAPLAAGVKGLLGAEEDAPEDRMNHFGLPAEAGERHDGGRGGEGGADGATVRSVLSKALVCLGDIACYREQYKGPARAEVYEGSRGEAQGVRAAPELRVGSRRTRATRRSAFLVSFAFELYDAYEGETLASVAWCLRALCVRAAFDTAGGGGGGGGPRGGVGARAGGGGAGVNIPGGGRGAAKDGAKGMAGRGIGKGTTRRRRRRRGGGRGDAARSGGPLQGEVVLLTIAHLPPSSSSRSSIP
ncbi:hypothetical protein DFH07DRAFT_956282 [Mycena maculata]|uniref:Telomerase activating protein Est1-like N-terminal domain-containing protein n=1 Tax=Mycena maculata TaxID=230809 RepID=A0AAD7JIA4_9AGAR|nr:hypothetical protein DFH07DRAFT_956282 [Mycena maculata]